MGNECSISIRNDEDQPRTIWFQLLGGGCPAGGWRETVLQPGEHIDHGFTLSLPVQLVATDNEGENHFRSCTSPPWCSSKVWTVRVTDIVADRNCNEEGKYEEEGPARDAKNTAARGKNKAKKEAEEKKKKKKAAKEAEEKKKKKKAAKAAEVARILLNDDMEVARIMSIADRTPTRAA
jgi:hypothetical protein